MTCISTWSHSRLVVKQLSFTADMEQYFFLFGRDDSYISKSSEGLTYRNPPRTLLRLLASGIMSNVEWASIGPGEDSWVLPCMKEKENTKIYFGDGCPSALKSYLFDEESQTVRRDGNVRVVFGSKSGFFAWGRNSMRWSNSRIFGRNSTSMA